MKFIVAILIVALAGATLAGESEWPKTMDEAVNEIVSNLSDEDKERVKQTKEEDIILFHHGWGTGIRNEFGLWQGNNELIKSACGFLCHPDDASKKIIESVWRKLNEAP